MRHPPAISFELEIHASITSWDEAERVAAATMADGQVLVVTGRRRRWARNRAPSIHFDWQQGQAVLSNEADWNHDCFLLHEQRRHFLASTVLSLSNVLAPGWGLRAYWIGDPLKHVRSTSAEELAGAVRRSQLNRYTLYRVT